MTVIDQIAALTERIARVPETRVTLRRSPSGAATLDVLRRDRLYVLDYSPTRGFGVDEVKEDEGFLVSYAFTSRDFEPAAEHLWELVTGHRPAADVLATSRPLDTDANGT